MAISADVEFADLLELVHSEELESFELLLKAPREAETREAEKAPSKCVVGHGEAGCKKPRRRSSQAVAERQAEARRKAQAHMNEHLT